MEGLTSEDADRAGKQVMDITVGLAKKSTPIHAVGFVLGFAVHALAKMLDLDWSEERVDEVVHAIGERMAEEKQSGKKWVP